MLTLPSFRGQGLARLGVLAAMNSVRLQLRADFGLLLCRPALVRFLS